MRSNFLAGLQRRLRFASADADLARACTGDARQCGLVFDKHGPAMLRFAHWVAGHRELANDVVQDIFVQMLEQRLSYSPELGEERSFLLTVTRRRLISALRLPSTASQPGVDDDIPNGTEPSDDGASDPMEQLVRAREAGFVGTVLRRLPFPQREVLVLREFEGCSYEEIAALVQIPIGTVRSRILRARKSFLAHYLSHTGECP